MSYGYFTGSICHVTEFHRKLAIEHRANGFYDAARECEEGLANILSGRFKSIEDESGQYVAEPELKGCGLHDPYWPRLRTL